MFYKLATLLPMPLHVPLQYEECNRYNVVNIRGLIGSRKQSTHFMNLFCVMKYRTIVLYLVEDYCTVVYIGV
jgi:hypothetical protein